MITNVEEEKSYHDGLKRTKTTTNPWDRVVSNIELNTSSYVGTKDVSRMK
jgi:hypothetical protein